MPNSFAQSAELTCPQCHQLFTADVWQIVDVTERPDLLERIQAATLHDLPCPHCSNVCTLDVPLLVYQTDDAPHLIFYPVQGTSDEEAPQQAGNLLDKLFQTLGNAWQDEWLAQMAVVPRPLLAATLRRTPEHVRQQTMPSWLDIIDEFINADSWGESQRIVSTYPELLNEAIDALMALLASLQKDNDTGASWEEHRALLRRCREIGIDQAFAEKLGATSATPQSGDIPVELRPLFAALAALPAAQRDAITHIFASISNAADREQALNADPDLRAAFEQVWAEASGQTSLPAALQDDLRQAQADEANYLRTGNLAALDAAVAAWQRILPHPALTMLLPDVRLVLLNDAGGSFLRRYWACGRMSDLEQALHLRAAVVAQTAVDDPNRPTYLSNLGNSLRNRYVRTGQLDDLEQAIAAFQQAVAQTAPDDPDRPTYLSNLGNSLRDRYVRNGQLDDLEQAIAAHQQAVAQTAPDDPDRPIYLNNLGNSLNDRYKRTGRLDDIEQAIAAYQQAVAQTAPDDPNRPIYLNNLGLSLNDRYKRTGRLDDIEQAIAAYQQAVAQTAPDDPNRPDRLSNLGNSLRNRYVRTGQLDDLEQAISAHQQAVAQTAPDDPNRPRYLSNLGNSLSNRDMRTGQLDDLEQAIAAHQQAVAQTAPDDPNRPGYLNNLGRCLRVRYERNGQLDDLEQAIAAFQQVVAQTAPDDPSRPIYLSNLGTGLRDRYMRTEQLDDLEQGANCYRQACEHGLTIALEETVRSAMRWGDWAVAHAAWVEASAACAYGLTAIDRLFAVQLARRNQENALALGQSIRAQATYALARSGDPATAAATLERGRARLLAEALERNRRDLELLPARGHAALYQRYRNTIEEKQRLLQPTIASPGPDGSGLTHLQAVKAAQAEIDATITAIQQIPGYEDFFAQPTIAQLQAVAQVAPLVYLLTTETGGLALIVQADKVTPVWLDEFTKEKLREHITAWFGAYSQQHTSRKTWLDTMEHITHVLWDEVMGPVAAALCDLTTPSTRSVTLIPTGLLSLLPLHAAWTSTDTGSSEKLATSRRYFLDEYTVAYAPSATALRHAQARAQTVTVDRLLAIDEPRPVDGNELPNSAREVAAVADHFAQPRIFAHESATRQAVLAALTGKGDKGHVDVAHFSCHGGNDWQNPLESGLLMAHDEMLTVRDLLELQLPGARLATLSACETGIVGTDLPDEVVALPSALVQAGFAGVVASLWSVADISTAMLMSRFYDFWQGEQREPAQALRGAQQWVRDTTNREKADYFGQELIVESGASKMPSEIAADFFSAMMSDPLGQEARSFAHPYWWAAFYLTGV